MRSKSPAHEDGLSSDSTAALSKLTVAISLPFNGRSMNPKSHEDPESIDKISELASETRSTNSVYIVKECPNPDHRYTAEDQSIRVLSVFQSYEAAVEFVRVYASTIETHTMRKLPTAVDSLPQPDRIDEEWTRVAIHPTAPCSDHLKKEFHACWTERKIVEIVEYPLLEIAPQVTVEPAVFEDLDEHDITTEDIDRHGTRSEKESMDYWYMSGHMWYNSDDDDEIDDMEYDHDTTVNDMTEDELEQLSHDRYKPLDQVVAEITHGALDMMQLDLTEGFIAGPLVDASRLIWRGTDRPEGSE